MLIKEVGYQPLVQDRLLPPFIPNRLSNNNMALPNLIRFTTLACALLAGSAQAALLDGKTIRYDYLYPDINTTNPWQGSGTYTVGAGVEANSGLLSVDFSDTQIVIDLMSLDASFATDQFNGFRFTDANNSIDSFASVDVNTDWLSIDRAAFDKTRVTFDENTIWVNASGVSYRNGGTLTLTITGAAPTNTNTVPEPATWGLAGLGLLAAARARRRR